MGRGTFFFLVEIFLQKKNKKNKMPFQIQIYRSNMVFHSNWKAQPREILEVTGYLLSLFSPFSAFGSSDGSVQPIFNAFVHVILILRLLAFCWLLSLKMCAAFILPSNYKNPNLPGFEHRDQILAANPHLSLPLFFQLNAPQNLFAACPCSFQLAIEINECMS